MLEYDRPEPRASTGLDALDVVFGGLYWGDNVVWQHAGVSVNPFYSAISALNDVFDTRTFVSVGESPEGFDLSGLGVIAAGPGRGLSQPADLLNAVQRASQRRGRHLFLFDSLDSMVQAWGARSTRGFFARCCPMLLEMGTIAYWAMDLRQTPSIVRDAVEAVTQCVLRVDERSIRVTKAEGRADGVRGSVLYWREQDGLPVLSPATSASCTCAGVSPCSLASCSAQARYPRIPARNSASWAYPNSSTVEGLLRSVEADGRRVLCDEGISTSFAFRGCYLVWTSRYDRPVVSTEGPVKNREFWILRTDSPGSSTRSPVKLQMCAGRSR